MRETRVAPRGTDVKEIALRWVRQLVRYLACPTESLIRERVDAFYALVHCILFVEAIGKGDSGPRARGVQSQPGFLSVHILANCHLITQVGLELLAFPGRLPLDPEFGGIRVGCALRDHGVSDRVIQAFLGL